MQARDPVILHGGDDVIRLLLFWSMFAPLNGRWSLDSLLNPSRPPLHVANASWGTQALMLQLCFIYWFTAAWKWHPIWIKEGSAIYYALSLDQFAKPLGKVLIQYPDVMRAMTHGTVALELLGPFFLFIPIWTARVRLLVVLTFIAFHAGIGLTMALGTFPWICSAAWLMFVPALVWERLGSAAWGRWGLFRCDSRQVATARHGPIGAHPAAAGAYRPDRERDRRRLLPHRLRGQLPGPPVCGWPPSAPPPARSVDCRSRAEVVAFCPLPLHGGWLV